jgi:phenylalanine-4-hydroxylase
MLQIATNSLVGSSNRDTPSEVETVSHEGPEAFMADIATPLPPHLARYVVPQEYEAYTPRDQAVWRHILRRLTARLKDRAHPSYLTGLEAAGIDVETIPSLQEMNARLGKLGWRAVGVRGFIPPAVFTEMQAMRVLAIAADIRTHEHIEYTPAPDIVHESAGHAPILADPRYAEYVRRCGVVGFKAIASREDQAVYEAIRNLSVVKEDPASTREDEREAEARLLSAQAGRTYMSESTRASRLYWWTAEYGLVGSLDEPRIYGAGILSSLGEAAHCFAPEVKKIPLSLACVEQDFDITSMQPQLFVARDFDHLFEVLEAFESTLSWRRGGAYGLAEAVRAGTVNHLILDSDLEVSGRVARVVAGIACLDGLVLVSRGGVALGAPREGPALVVFGAGSMPEEGEFRLDLGHGLQISGFMKQGGEATLIQATMEGRALDLPRDALVFLCGRLVGVAGGPADPEAWDLHLGATRSPEGDAERLARQRKRNALPAPLGALYQEVRVLRHGGGAAADRLAAILEALKAYPEDWLLALEVEELLGSVTV